MNKFQNYFYSILINIFYILIILSYFGLSQFAPKYVKILDYYIKIYVCLFLIWRFNPLRSHFIFTDLDRKIAFSAGFIILTSIVLQDVISNFMFSNSQ
jgi:hypothetical protein